MPFHAVIVFTLMGYDFLFQSVLNRTLCVCKGGLTSEGIFTLVQLPRKCAKSCPWVKNLNKLFTENGGKFKFSAQGQDLAPFDCNVTKVKIPSEIKPPSYLGGLKIDASTHLFHLVRLHGLHSLSFHKGPVIIRFPDSPDFENLPDFRTGRDVR